MHFIKQLINRWYYKESFSANGFYNLKDLQYSSNKKEQNERKQKTRVQTSLLSQQKDFFWTRYS